MIGQIYTSNYVPPFSGMTPCKRVRSIKKRKDTGVYIIRERGRIVYVGMSQSCVTEALYRHFYPYNDKHRRPRTYYPNDDDYTVYILYTSKEDAPKLERGLILSINPRDNRDKFQRYLDDLCVKNIEEQQAVVVDVDLPF